MINLIQMLPFFPYEPFSRKSKFRGPMYSIHLPPAIGTSTPYELNASCTARMLMLPDRYAEKYKEAALSHDYFDDNDDEYMTPTMANVAQRTSQEIILDENYENTKSVPGSLSIAVDENYENTKSAPGSSVVVDENYVNTRAISVPEYNSDEDDMYQTPVLAPSSNSSTLSGHLAQSGLTVKRDTYENVPDQDRDGYYIIDIHGTTSAKPPAVPAEDEYDSPEENTIQVRMPPPPIEDDYDSDYAAIDGSTKFVTEDAMYDNADN